MTALPHRHPRRGFALMDAIVGGVMLGIGLAVVLTLASRAIASHPLPSFLSIPIGLLRR